MKKYFQAPWTVQDILKSSGISLLLLVASFVTLQYLDFTSLKAAEHTKLFIGFVIQWIIILGPAAFLILNKYKPKFSDLGFTKIGIFQTIKHVLSAYLLYLGINFIVSTIVIYSGLKIPGYQIQESLAPVFDSSTETIILGVLIVVIAAPIIEEVFFRGLILRPMVNKLGSKWGSVATALMFSLLHIPWQSFIPIFILGMIINYTVVRSHSLWPAIVFHIINNVLVFTLQILISKNIISIEPLFISFT